MNKNIKPIKIPLIRDNVLSPEVHYSPDLLHAIYIVTEDDTFGRITFESMDSIRICRGEYEPFKYKWSKNSDIDIWIYEIKNSSWKQERYLYEKKHYGKTYEFGGSVEEMLTDFKHYYFNFHDEFIEVIAKGFWFEMSDKPLFKQPLEKNHPFSPINSKKAKIEIFDKYKIFYNTKSKKELIKNAHFCTQTLMEFRWLDSEFETTAYSYQVFYKEEVLYSKLSQSFGKDIFCTKGIVKFDDVKKAILSNSNN